MRKIPQEEKALLIFLEEWDRTSDGEKEGRTARGERNAGWEETEELKIGKHLPGNTFPRLFWYIFHMSRGMKRTKAGRGKGRRRRRGAERNEHLYCINAQSDWQHNGLPALKWKEMKELWAEDRKLKRLEDSITAPKSTNKHSCTRRFLSYIEHFYSFFSSGPPSLHEHKPPGHTHPSQTSTHNTQMWRTQILTASRCIVASANVGLREASTLASLCGDSRTHSEWEQQGDVLRLEMELSLGASCLQSRKKKACFLSLPTTIKDPHGCTFTHVWRSLRKFHKQSINCDDGANHHHNRKLGGNI